MSMIEDLFGLRGKVALVTGGTSGLGRMIARGLLSAGARVYVVGRDAERCEAVAGELSEQGTCRAIAGDLASIEGIGCVSRTLQRREERLDILVNNAGVLDQQPIDEYCEAFWDRALDTNVKAAFFLTQALLPHLRQAASAADPARVLNIGSGHGLRVSMLDHFGYSVSKAGIHHLTRVLAAKLAPDNVNVNAIAPGMFATRQNADFPPDQVAQILAAIPRRRLGQETDIMAAALYLCSPGGAYTTGVVLPVDGGRSLS